MKYKINFAFDYVFPTFILPNATMPEFGVINYLSSMHSLKAQNATTFEQSISVSDIFDNELGVMPNSNTGYFYQAQVYESILNYKEEALYFRTRNPQSFIYPIKPTAVLSHFFGKNVGPNIRMNGEYFWKYISKKAMEYIKAGKCKIFIDYSMEPFIEYETFLDIHNCLSLSDLPNKSVIICINSFNAKDGALSTFLFDVIEKHICKLIDAGNTEKRKSDIFAVEYMDGVTPVKSIMGEGNRKKAIPVIDYDGDKNIQYCPSPRGAPMAQRLWEEREPEVWED
jgi:hypothetical protein